VFVTTRTEAASQVRKVLQSIKDRIAQPGGFKVNEATTRAHFLNPLLDALGYRSIDDIVFEHYLPDGKTFLDYRLVVDGKPRVAVEAKALEVTLTDKDAAQAVSYATILGDEWAVVTNAREWRLYHTFARAALPEKLILTVNLVSWSTDSEFDAVFDQLWLISKESFLAGEGPGSWLKNQKLDHVLRRSLTDSESAEVKYIRKQLEAKGVSVTADQVASWLKVRLDPAQSQATAKVEQTPYPQPQSTLPATKVTDAAPAATKPVKATVSDGPRHWIIPSGKRAGFSSTEHLKTWLGKGFWGFGQSTPGRKSIRVGDWACFYVAQSHQVLAYARIAGELDTHVSLEDWPGPGSPDLSIYKVPLETITWLEAPVTVDAATRVSLDAYAGKEPTVGWSWLIQTSRKISEADFLRLTGRA
jgi:hypothetical protein